MRQRFRRWRRAQRRRLIPEGVMIPLRSWRFVALTVLYPRQSARGLHHRFRLWACLPGDAFLDWQADLTLIVRDVKPGAVTFYAFTNELLDHPDRIGQYGRRPTIALERRDRSRLGGFTCLLPDDDDLVRRARALIA